MNPETFAQITLPLYAAVAAGVIFWLSGRCRYGRVVWWLHVINRIYCGVFYRWRSNTRCPYPDRGPAIIVSNHRSGLDPIFLWMNHHLGADGEHEVRPISFIMAREFYEVPMFNWAFRALRSIPVERAGKDMASAREALRHLAEGDLVGIFPEGRINRNPGEALLEADTGVAWLALRAEVPVIPVFIQGAPRREEFLEPFYTPAKVRVIYGEPIDLAPYAGRRKTQELLREVADLIMTRLAELGGASYPVRPSPATADSPAEPPTLLMERATG